MSEKEYKEIEIKNIVHTGQGVSSKKKTPYISVGLLCGDGGEIIEMRLYLSEKAIENAVQTVTEGLGFKGGSWNEFIDMTQDDIVNKFKIPEGATAMVETNTWTDNYGEEKSQERVAGVKGVGFFSEQRTIDKDSFKELIGKIGGEPFFDSPQEGDPIEANDSSQPSW